MNRKKLKILIILVVLVLVIYLMSGSIVKFITYLKDEQMINSVITGFCTIISAVIAIIGVHFTINNNQKLKNKELLNSLDQKSEWRKELMNIASQTFMTTDDLYRVLASLRFQPHKDTESKEDFKFMTKKIYGDLNDMLNEKYNSKIKQKLSEKSCFKNKDYTIYLEYKDTEIIRLYTKYLLKHHWETNIDEAKWLKDQEEVIKEVKKLREEIF